ncbi:TerB family tellurite resistance protein [Cribrihabitans neustonicus]|uniref:tellurite resistance TerB family protein n=1 Tax=Cribrihabitans neustonicus TaxID=1429085 RepID=UPI003B5BABED
MSKVSDDRELADRLSEVDVVVSDPFRFKARLEIGEKAFQTLTLRNKAFEFWDMAGVAVTGAQVAKSATVASAFFSTTSGGFLGLFATTTAFTPIGWVIAAGLASGGAYYGIVRLMKGLDDDRIDVVPKFINTPLDVLGASLLDLIAPLALKVAAADGKILEEELEVIRSYFVEGWGFNPEYVEIALQIFSAKLDDLSLRDLTEELRKFTLESRDCNHKRVREKIIQLLREVAEADGQIHELEELMIQHVAEFLPKDPWFQMPKFDMLPSVPKLPGWKSRT